MVHYPSLFVVAVTEYYRLGNLERIKVSLAHGSGDLGLLTGWDSAKTQDHSGITQQDRTNMPEGLFL